MAMIELFVSALRILLRVTRPYSLKFLDIVYRIIFGPKPKLPPIDDKILLMPAVELAEKIRKKQLKSEDVVKAYIKRIKEVDPIINACLDHRFDEAIKDAKEIDTFISSGTKAEADIERDTPLLGVPFSTKEFIGVKGMAQSSGRYKFRGHKAENDGATVTLYKKAGAIPLTVTNIPEHVAFWDSVNCFGRTFNPYDNGMAQSSGRYKFRGRKAENDGATVTLYKKAGAIPLTVTNIPEHVAFWDSVNCFGRTFNPYDNVRSSGGTTGGEAALLAYAGAIMGVGNDLYGSIRIPAAFNGVYAHNPSPGMISNAGIWPETWEGIKTLLKAGPLFRYVKDLPLLANVLSEGRINFHKKQLKFNYPPWMKVDFRKIKVYYMEQFPGYLVEPMPDIKAAVRKAAYYFNATYSNMPKEICIPELKHTPEITKALLIETNGPSPRSFIEADNLFFEFLKFMFGISKYTLPIFYLAATAGNKKDENHYRYLAMFDVLKSKLDSILDEDSVLLIPTHPETAVHHLMTIPKSNNKAYTSLNNFFGHPATQIPAGFSDGLPIGIQILSKQDNDYLCIQTAVELEKLFGGWKSPSKIIV